jgi:sulfate transport system ATP-binding protein
MSIILSNISKQFGQFAALHDVNLDIPEGELVALLGPSGCGKTTLLRIIAGLEKPDQGRVLLSGEDKTEQHVSRRGIGFVFQHYALFRHMTVFDNVAFGLRVKPRAMRPKEADISKKVQALLELVQLDWLGNRFPDQLSGGQRQRIALARALAVEPNVLLLDEPFGALDASVRKDLRQWLRNLHQSLHVTSIFVTHDQEEAMEVASQVVVLNHGRVQQQGAPADIYDHPANAFVSQFIGQTNLLPQDAIAPEWFSDGAAVVTDRAAVAHVRPQHIAISKAAEATDSAIILNDWQHLGSSIRVELLNRQSQPASRLYAEMPNDTFKQLNIQKGDRLAVSITQAKWFEASDSH